MGRFSFVSGKQKMWVEKILKKSGLRVDEIAKICGVCSRTIRDWRREKFTIDKDVCMFLSQKFNVDIPEDVKELSDFWYGMKGARSGGLMYYKLYGAPGTIETRRLGGIISQEKRRKDPNKYRLLGCNVQNSYPSIKPSSVFAEVSGIILGDGGITKDQVRITLDSESDREYISYVHSILKKLFQHEPSEYKRKKQKATDICLSGIELVRLLNKWGLKEGDKIKRQIDFPDWIWKEPEYQKMCVRGLVDTDGCVYLHYHIVNGIKYRNIGICFRNYSVPLLKSVSKVLSLNGIKNTLDIRGGVWVYSLKEVKKYLEVFGSSNPKHYRKLDYHLLYNRRLS